MTQKKSLMNNYIFKLYLLININQLITYVMELFCLVGIKGSISPFNLLKLL